MYTKPMDKAVRAIIIENGKLLVMYRNKFGSEYYTLVGGRVKEGEALEHALVREIKEETGLDVTAAQMVFIEEHRPPYNEQYIYYCNIGQHDDVKIQDTSEEAFLNRMEANIHKPVWTDIASFGSLSFRTPQLQQAILTALRQGFPDQPIKL